MYAQIPWNCLMHHMPEEFPSLPLRPIICGFPIDLRSISMYASVINIGQRYERMNILPLNHVPIFSWSAKMAVLQKYLQKFSVDKAVSFASTQHSPGIGLWLPGPVTATGGLELGPVRALTANIKSKWNYSKQRFLELGAFWNERTNATTLTLIAQPYAKTKLTNV